MFQCSFFALSVHMYIAVFFFFCTVWSTVNAPVQFFCTVCPYVNFFYFFLHCLEHAHKNFTHQGTCAVVM